MRPITSTAAASSTRSNPTSTATCRSSTPTTASTSARPLATLRRLLPRHRRVRRPALGPKRRRRQAARSPRHPPRLHRRQRAHGCVVGSDRWRRRSPRSDGYPVLQPDHRSCRVPVQARPSLRQPQGSWIADRVYRRHRHAQVGLLAAQPSAWWSACRDRRRVPRGSSLRGAGLRCTHGAHGLAVRSRFAGRQVRLRRTPACRAGCSDGS